MKIGGSIALIAIGAIVAFALPNYVGWLNLLMIGYILMGAGVLALILTIAFDRPGRLARLNRTSESRTVLDPETGERIRRTEVSEH